MKIITWNVNQKPGAVEREDVAGADIYLFNEAPPELRMPDGVSMQGEIRTVGLDCPHEPGACKCNRRWAATIASPHSMEPIEASLRSGGTRREMKPTRPGSWLARTVAVGEEKVTAISLYGLLDERADASVHRSLSELTPILENERFNRLLVLGGDLNTLARDEEGSPGLARDLGVLDRITQVFGLTDLLQRAVEEGQIAAADCDCARAACAHVQTHRHEGNETVPYQDDYLFASPSLAGRLNKVNLLAFEPSDHAPVIAWQQG